ncbi:MAG: hypothetical protein ACTTJC_02810 [Campylobacter sp.]
MREEEPSIDELSYELSIMLEAMLYQAGVKKEMLQDAADVYIECIDDALEKSDAQGVDEILEVVKYMQKHHGRFFK